MKPMFRSLGGSWLTRSPAINMSPEVGLSRPEMTRRIVDFPQPLGPTIVRNSSGRTSRSTLSTAVNHPSGRRGSGNLLDRLRSVIAVVIGAPFPT